MEQQRMTVDIKEAARILGISRGLAYAMAKQNRLPIIRLGRRMVVPKAALDRMLAEAGKTNN